LYSRRCLNEIFLDIGYDIWLLPLQLIRFHTRALWE